MCRTLPKICFIDMLSANFHYLCIRNVFDILKPLHMTEVDILNHKHVTSLVKAATTPFNHQYTSQFKRKEL